MAGNGAGCAGAAACSSASSDAAFLLGLDRNAQRRAAALAQDLDPRTVEPMLLSAIMRVNCDGSAIAVPFTDRMMSPGSSPFL